MIIPSLFDWLLYFDFLQGVPTLIIVTVTAALIVLFLDWRLALLALIIQYLTGVLLFVELLDPRLAIVKLLTGMFVCLILYLTARQVDYGKVPEDITEQELAQFDETVRVSVGRWKVRRDLIIKSAAVALVILLVLLATTVFSFSLPGTQNVSSLTDSAILMLMGMGIAGLLTNRDPLSGGMNLLTFLMGFELYMASFDSAINLLLALTALNLVVALAISYLSQARRAALFARLND